MNRLIYVPQFPVPLRYNFWWISMFTKEFKKEYDEIIMLGSKYLQNNNHNSDYNNEMFSPINRAIEFETEQIKDYMELNIRDDDVLFLSDISFPGIFCNVLFHKRPSKMYAFCHATSLNKYDYFEKDRNQKFKIETSHASLFDKIFFGSQYSLNKTGWENGIVTALPDSPKDLILPSTNKSRPIDIVSVCRPSIQKVNKKLEKKVEKTLSKKIYRQKTNTWLEYNQLLAQSKVMLTSSKEDTFNYTIMDAIRCGCIPMVPDKLCFPEILPDYWRYKDADDLIVKLKYMFKNDKFILPDVICRDKVDNFFENIIKIMKG